MIEGVGADEYAGGRKREKAGGGETGQSKSIPKLIYKNLLYPLH